MRLVRNQLGDAKRLISRNCYQRRNFCCMSFSFIYRPSPPGYATPTFNWRVANCSKQQVAGLLLNNMLSASRDHKGDGNAWFLFRHERPRSLAASIARHKTFAGDAWVPSACRSKGSVYTNIRVTRDYEKVGWFDKNVNSIRACVENQSYYICITYCCRNT